MATIYALLVGINNYTSSPLKGCINDVKAVKEYLEEIHNKSKGRSLKIKVLTDKEKIKPTRQNLIESFSFFDGAKKGDFCLFYYSGHGSFIVAPKEFESDSGFLQSFVCIDSREPGGKDIIDKEMGFLLWKTMINKTGVTFLAITDCCHSGTITKAMNAGSVTDRMVDCRSDNVHSTLIEYLGFDEEVNDQKGYELNSSNKYVVKPAKHIHLASSKDNQTSKELDIDGVRRGVFTHSLLKILYNTGSQISYKELIEQTSAIVRNTVREQEPDININGNLAADEKDKFFLSGENAVSDPRYLVYHHPKYGWCIKAGPMHNVTKGDKVIIENVCKTVVTGSPSPDLSIIMGKLELGTREQSYYAKVIRQPNQSLKVSFSDEVSTGVKKLLLDTQLPAPSSFVSLQLEGEGVYIIRTNKIGELYISLPGNDSPIFKPVTISNKEDAAHFVTQLEIVSKWKNLLEFNNPVSILTNKDYTIKLFRSVNANGYDPGTFTHVKDILPINELYYMQSGEKWYQPAIRISITNHTKYPLWVTNAYLEFDYAITTDGFSTLEIGSRNEAFLGLKNDDNADKVVKLKVDKKYQELGYKEITEYVKLFISTSKISTDNLKQEGVDLVALGTKSLKMGYSSKSFGDEEEEDLSTGVRWKTETIGFKIIKPAADSDITEGKPTKVGPLIIRPHSGLTGKATINSSSNTFRSADGFLPPHLAFNNSYLEPFDLVEGTRSGSTTDVLEIFAVKDRSVVTAKDPLIIQLPVGRSADAIDILPIGYDIETKLYYPVGYTSKDGDIIIEVLPEETASDAAITQKSFLGSIKIYFQKVIGRKLGFKYEYPRLAIPGFGGKKLTYNSDAKFIKDKIAAANKVAVFIHGIIGDTEGMANCINTPIDADGNTLGKKYDLFLTFDYENLDTTIQENASLLKEKLVNFGLEEGHGKELIIVAHSMGGLISRWFIEKLGGGKIVSHLYMLGTPNNGSPWADVRDVAETMLTYAINGAAFLKPWTFLLSIIGKGVGGMQNSLKQMDSETGIYKELNDGTDPSIPYTIVAGNTKNIVVKYDETGSLISRLFTRIKKRGVYDGLDLVLFKKPNDIAATVESIRQIKSSENWKIKPKIYEVACDHLNYFVLLDSINVLNK